MGFFGNSYELLPIIDSTNNYAAECVSQHGMADGAAILSFNQQSGRGQRQKNWLMTPYKDLAVTYCVKPVLSIEGLFVFNKTICLAVSDFLTEELGAGVSVKWPNDVFYQDRKVSGLLIEPTWSGDFCKHILLGIGLNVNGFTSQKIATGVSLAELKEESLDLMSVFARLNKALDARYAQWQAEDWGGIHAEYKERLYLQGEEVLFETAAGEQGCATVLDVNQMGRLKLLINEVEQDFAHGEVIIKAQS